MYTALETEQIKAYEKAFNQIHPDIKLRIVRDSTGVIVAKLLTEKDNSQADVIWGVAITGLGVLDQQGMLEPYAPSNFGHIKKNYRDKKIFPTCGDLMLQALFYVLTHWKHKKEIFLSLIVGKSY